MSFFIVGFKQTLLYNGRRCKGRFGKPAHYGFGFMKRANLLKTLVESGSGGRI